jgi:hypothetical protein
MPYATIPRLAIHHRLFLYCLHRVARYPPYTGVQLTRALGRGAWGFSFFLTVRLFSTRNALLQLSHEVLDSPLMLQQDGHDDCLKRPWAGDHDPSLDVQLGAIEEPVEERLIGFRKGFFERHPAAAFCFNALAERRQGFCPWHDPLTMGALKCLRKFHWS